MRISVEDGIVVCSLEDKSVNFLSKAGKWFEGFYKDKLKLGSFFGNADNENILIVQSEYRVIGLIKLRAKENGVEITREVRELFDGRQAYLKSLIDKDYARRTAEYEKRKQKERWQQLCEHGCGKLCKYRRGAIAFCEATEEWLKFKKVVKKSNGESCGTDYVPFPSENCPYNIKNKQGEN